MIEFCVGLSSPIAGTLRSKYVPDAYQGAIMNIFRLPLNAVVVSGTYATDVFDHYKVYGIVSGLFLVAAAALQATLVMSGRQGKEQEERKITIDAPVSRLRSSKLGINVLAPSATLFHRANS